jgi:hypothetical protein
MESFPLGSDKHLLKEAFQVIQQRQQDPPAGRYPLSKNDHVMTKMKHLPPSPCKVWGSKNHWDKECPDFNIYNEQLKRNVKFGAVSIFLRSVAQLREHTGPLV